MGRRIATDTARDSGRASSIFLVRHAQAGDRNVWHAPDAQRPLTGRGRHQARQIARRLARGPVGVLLSSPAARCVQTLEPMAARVNGQVAVDERLAEGAALEPFLQLLGQVSDGTVLCSHGDLIPAAVDALARLGMEIQGVPDHRKAACWVLQREGSRFARAHAISPPDRPALAR